MIRQHCPSACTASKHETKASRQLTAETVTVENAEKTSGDQPHSQEVVAVVMKWSPPCTNPMCEMATAERGADVEALTPSMVWPTERSALLAEPGQL